MPISPKLISRSVVLGILIQFLAIAQELDVEQYTTRDGLPSQYVNDIYQGAFGRIWFATSEGLCVYDGVQFKTYRMEDGLPQNILRCVSGSRESPSALWVGTHGAGFFRFDEGSVTTYKVSDIRESNYISALVESKNGQLWIGTLAGVYRASRTGEIARFQIEGDDYPAGVLEILESGDQHMWLGLESSIAVVAPDGNVRKIDLRLLPGEHLANLILDGMSNFWIGTSRGDLVFYENGTMRSRTNVSQIAPHRILDDGNGILWICAEEGLLRIPKEWARQNTPGKHWDGTRLLGKIIISGCVDREGVLWLGTYGHGLYKTQEKGLVRFPLRTPLGGGFYYNPPAVSDSQGHFWITDGGGVLEIWQTESSTWKQEWHQLTDKRVITLQSGRENTLWAGLSHGTIGVYKLVSKGSYAPSRVVMMQSLRPGIELPPEKWMYFVLENDGSLWLSISPIGAVMLDGRQSRKYTWITEKDGLRGNNIRAFYRDGRNNVWLGDVTHGISVFREDGHGYQRIDSIFSSGYPPGDAVRSIMVDPNGALWVGTRNGGLKIRNDELWRTMTASDGLLSNTVWSIARDSSGLVWIATSQGVQCLDPSTFRIVKTLPDPDGRDVRAVGVAGGMLWGCTDNGFFVYDLLEFRRGRKAPVVSIQGIAINGASQTASADLKLRYDQNNIAINYIGTSFRSEKQVRYQYRLLGADEAWNPLTTERGVVYPSLDPGDYTFEVHAQNSDGDRSVSPATVAFSIAPAWWTTWWSQVLAVLLVATALFTLHRTRVAKLIALERTRLGIARDLHDEVGSTLSSISHFARALKDEAQAKEVTLPERFLQLITESSASAKASMSDIVWSIDPSNDSWESLAAKFRRFAADMLESKGIRYDIDITETLPGLQLTMERRRHLWLVYKEIVTNTAKHAQCSSMRITLRAVGRKVSLTIEDNGRGFDPANPSEGNGLRNIKARAQLLNGSATLTTSAGNGTCWEVLFQV